MAGQLGNERVTIQSQLVYKTDFKRNLIYIRGAIPGKIGGLVMLKDAVKKHDQWKILNYPTFIAVEGASYPNIQEYIPKEDMSERYAHDNDEVLGVSEEEEEGEPEKNTEEDGPKK
jgi:hypothetical protein